MKTEKKFRTPLWWLIVCLAFAWWLYGHAHAAHAFGFAPGGTGGSDLSGGAAPNGTGGGWGGGWGGISCGGCGAGNAGSGGGGGGAPGGGNR